MRDPSSPCMSSLATRWWRQTTQDWEQISETRPLDMQSNAADVIYSIAAAHAAVPGLGRKWVAMGESAGGLAALAVAGLESDIRDPDYLGSIAISGIADAKEFYLQAADGEFARPAGCPGL